MTLHEILIGAAIVVVLGLTATGIGYAIKNYEPPCPCEQWEYVEGHWEYGPVMNFEGKMVFKNHYVHPRWHCISRYPKLPEGGCGYIGQDPVTQDAPKRK